MSDVSEARTCYLENHTFVRDAQQAFRLLTAALWYSPVT